jgi:hypothetical protein
MDLDVNSEKEYRIQESGFRKQDSVRSDQGTIIRTTEP